MNPGEYRRMYEAEETQWWYAGMRALSRAMLEAPLRSLAGGGRRLSILDAGCGTGRNLALFAPWGRAVGVDLSKDALAFCRERGVPAARAGLLALPFAESSFSHTTDLAKNVKIPVIASGLVKSIDDISTLSYLAGISGVITSRALFGGKFTFKEANAIASQREPIAPFI